MTYKRKIQKSSGMTTVMNWWYVKYVFFKLLFIIRTIRYAIHKKMCKKYFMNYKIIINVIIIINLMHQILFLCQEIFFFLKSIINKSLFSWPVFCLDSVGLGRVLVTTWVRTGYCWAYASPPLSSYIDIDIVFLQMQYFQEFETMKKKLSFVLKYWIRRCIRSRSVWSATLWLPLSGSPDLNIHQNL